MELPEKFASKHPKIATFIKDKAPHLVEMVAGVLPNAGGLGIIKNLILNDPKISPEDKIEFAKLSNDADMAEGKEVTERHKNDMASDSWLSKNIRPMALIWLLLLLTVCAILDAAMKAFEMPKEYIDLIKVLLLLVFGFYFGGRTLEKIMAGMAKK